MSYKNLHHYRHTVHRYLDAIWNMGSHKSKARNTMYKTLALRMNLTEEETHASKFTRAQCKQAISILRPMYIQLYGQDLSYNKNKNKNKIENNQKKKGNINMENNKYKLSITDQIMFETAHILPRI